jgi:uncharacterized LabA/DUF88 family protein
MKKESLKFDKKIILKAMIFIDAANIELSAKDLGFKIDYKKLYKYLAENYRIEYLGFYTVRFETKSHDNFLTVLKKSGYKLVTKPLKIIKNRDKELGDIRKANFDVEIAVDAMKFKNNFETMILFSGDSDFDYLIKELKKNGKKVLVVSLSHHISKELIESADYYLDLKKIKKQISR